MRMAGAVRTAICVFGLMLGVSARAQADGFINPFFAYHFGADAACPKVFKCENVKLGLGFSIGYLGSVLGFEEDIGVGQNFFGTEPLLNSTVYTLMSNLMIAPKIGPVHPYVVGGFGLMHVSASTSLANIVVTDNNNAGYDLGGGVILTFGPHVGLRADVRGYRSVQDLKVFGIDIPGTKLRFGRAGGGVMFLF
jgi:opacity protein-like surface antigen